MIFVGYFSCIISDCGRFDILYLDSKNIFIKYLLMNTFWDEN